MELIQEYWYLWLFISAIGWGLLQFIGKNRSNEIQPGMATKSDQFSMKTVFLSFRSGEAQLFFTILSMLFFFFLFAIGLSKQIGLMLPG
ncbi:MAG: hypothetical protein OEY59_06550 [Deltaproteobacteria bacterium]|nr:hypothetical protein [Deltaproteobacteria bacterium]